MKGGDSNRRCRGFRAGSSLSNSIARTLIIPLLCLTGLLPGCNRPLPDDAMFLLADLFQFSEEVIAIRVMPQTPAMVKDSTLQFQALGTTRQGGTTDVTSVATWSSSDEVVATISNQSGSEGVATAVFQGGPVTITAEMNGVSSEDTAASARLLVTASPKRIFLSAGKTKGDLSSASAVDTNICSSDLNKPLTGTYAALLVDGSSRVACTSVNCSNGTTGQTGWVLAPDQPYFRTDNVTHIFTTNADGIFVFGSATNPIAAGGSKFWSGLNTDWTTSSSLCANWGNATQNYSGMVGSSGSKTSLLIGGAPQVCSADIPVVCVEQ